MPRNKILERAKVSMPSGRSAFDLSQIRSYDALAGELNVAYCQPMVAGTKGKISRKCFTRTAQVVSPAFHSVTEHFDFFIVPIHSLWRYWENWKVNINDLQDTMLTKFDSVNNITDLSTPVNVPNMDFDGVLSTVFGFDSSQTYSESSSPSIVARKLNDMLRLSDQLGYDEFLTGMSSGTKVMNLFFAAAYQKCYYDHYRNTSYEANDPYAYNLDWLSADSSHNGYLQPDADGQGQNLKDIYVAKKLFEMHRVNYRNDYFHNIYPNLNYVSSTVTGSQSFSIPSDVGQLLVGSNGSSQFDPSTVVAQGVQSGGTSTAVLRGGVVLGKNNSSYTSGISVQSIRAAFALDKLMRASAYAPKHVREQYKALYGVDGVEDFDMKSERIGSFQSDVLFQEVTNMAETTTSALGALGAKGIGSSGKDRAINFYCKYDSIVIGLHYFMPRARYDSFGLHPFNIKIAREQFFIKAFEHLGLRPFYRYYVDGQQSAVVLGWTEANFEYKILPDLNTGMFKRKFVNFLVHEPTTGTYVVVRNLSAQSPLSTFVPHTENALNTSVVTADYFKVAPEDLNNIFADSVGTAHVRTTTQFFGEFRISVPVVAPMSVHSQPSL